jgi:hypothetical protein
MTWSPRQALEKDIPALEELIPLSVRTLQVPFYSKAQMEAAISPVFNVDRQLIHDGTYFVVEDEGKIVACGGWSKRKKLSGCDGRKLVWTNCWIRSGMRRAFGRFLFILHGRDWELAFLF